MDDTAESSSDEDGPQEIPIVKESSTPGERPHGSKKFIKMVDRIAESKFFQAAAENRYIKKAMEGKVNFITNIPYSQKPTICFRCIEH